MDKSKVLIKIFGKEGCPACKITRDKIKALLVDFRSPAEVLYYDIDTLEGLTEAASASALDIPTVIIEKNSVEIKRWSKKFSEEELKKCL